ncbi:xanthine dehydrogenase family protein molybdopterin-binding subunit [Actinomycetospora sp. TBRC 11914]|uniref:xanthine dehydrogenase family protein molybdopterin-binding subunit n=1 Tax=Actinomycetospora sp. TBRC 11914 TaxID=2729387 RepID=UPI00145DCBC7|nr:xanthine dehydrogenase family protein molybdopterin-binding subunit [Actinomycetospora sp. TBRC 11914]NMO89401.1 xanthine dehydrogenase family protein molybdopterin-binding subunit [Actinomycetospora sp. TBRC 11914]
MTEAPPRTAGPGPAATGPRLVGTSVPRKEDLALLTGTARFIDDIRLPGMVHATILRSTVAHARVRSIDTAPARAVPGVLDVLAGAELVGKVKPWGDLMQDLLVGDHFPFATDKVLYEGQELAAVVAGTRYQALDGCEAVAVDLEELPAVVDPEQALRPDAPLVQERIVYEFGEGNVFDRYRVRVGDFAAAERDAAVVVRQRFTTNKQAGAALDPHGCVASHDPFTGVLTLWSSTQSVYMVRDVLADVLQIPRTKVRVMVPEVGAGFGSKAQMFGHEVIAALFSMRLGRPVKLVLRRDEIFRAGTTRNSQVRYAELAMAADGEITGYRDYVVHNTGAMSVWGNQVVHIGTNVGMLPYPIPNVHVDSDIVHTTTAPGGPLRGFGIPQTVWAKEQLVDMAARELGLDPLAVRERNVVDPATFPYRTPMGQVIDSTSIKQCLTACAEAIDWAAKRAAPVPHEGLGLAVSMKYTSCRHPSLDTDLSAVRLRLETDGTVTIYSSDVSHGQSHATMLSQIVADGLGVGIEKVTLAPPDSMTAPFGLGTYASRGAAVLGTACRLATERLRDKVLAIAAHVLEVGPGDLDTGNDRVFVKGLPDSGIYLEILAATAAYRTHQLPPDFEPTLETVATYDTPTEREASDGSGNLSVTYSGAAHAAHVRVDPETGRVTVVDYAMVHDTGTVINPLVVEGQHQGGFLMGMGMALSEDYVYDENGHQLNASFKDYLAVTAPEVPELTRMSEIPAPSTTIPGGQKGAGESGTGPVPAAIGNAVLDATGIRFTALPITPQRMLTALREKERRGVETLRYPDDMPDFTGPRCPDEWPSPTAAEADDFDFDFDFDLDPEEGA